MLVDAHRGRRPGAMGAIVAGARLSEHAVIEAVPQLLERSRELALLGELLAEVTDRGGGRLVLVKGEAGIGKTVLLRLFCDGLGSSVRVLWAACDPLFTPRPLGPLLDVARLTDGELRERIEADAKPHDVADALIRELGRRAPTVLVLEDLHC